MKIAAQQVKSIGVFRALQLGDLLCAVPALRALRAAYPSANITLLGLPWAAAFVNRFHHYVDDFVHFPGYPGLPEQSFDGVAYGNFIREMETHSFDLLLQMHGNGTIVNKMLLQCGAKNLAGFHNNASHIDSPLFLEYPNRLPEVRRHLSLMSHLGISSQGSHMEFPITKADEEEFFERHSMLANLEYVCVHPGSRGAARLWSPHHFAALAHKCTDEGYAVVITGTKEESSITSKVVQLCECPVIDLTGKTTLGTIACLLKNASLLIANCTGVSHIAAGLQTPSLIISMDGEPDRWRPANKVLHRVIDWTRYPNFQSVHYQLQELLKQIPSLHRW